MVAVRSMENAKRRLWDDEHGVKRATAQYERSSFTGRSACMTVASTSSASSCVRLSMRRVVIAKEKRLDYLFFIVRTIINSSGNKRQGRGTRVIFAIRVFTNIPWTCLTYCIRNDGISCQYEPNASYHKYRIYYSDVGRPRVERRS
eukprot:XP_001706098.1 Hypothetical protein GL50803_19430 [Giardia lamblia ATCC 50803]